MSGINLLKVLIIFSTLSAPESSYSTQHTLKNTSDRVLERRIGDVKTTQVAVTDALANALSTTRVSGGIIKAGSDKGEVRRLMVSGPRLRDLLEAITQASPQYRWEFNDGVVNLVDSSMPPLLDMHIVEFDAIGVKSAHEALYQLLERPDVKERVAHLKLNTGLKITTGGIAMPRNTEQQFNVRCRNATLREVLNAIVREQGHGVWLYRETHWDKHHGFEIEMIVP
ncbi:MAG: hypothetical protein ACR2G4_09300 [Pyrinomonadaceae bacterium]